MSSIKDSFLQDIQDVAECRGCVGGDIGRFDVPTVEEDGVKAARHGLLDGIEFAFKGQFHRERPRADIPQLPDAYRPDQFANP